MPLVSACHCIIEANLYLEWSAGLQGTPPMILNGIHVIGMNKGLPVARFMLFRL
jgi:hypothetical protein